MAYFSFLSSRANMTSAYDGVECPPITQIEKEQLTQLGPRNLVQDSDGTAIFLSLKGLCSTPTPPAWTTATTSPNSRAAPKWRGRESCRLDPASAALSLIHDFTSFSLFFPVVF